MLVIRRWGDRQLLAGRLDPVLGAMRVDERDHDFPRRSSSAWAKNADALRRIWLARRLLVLALQCCHALTFIGCHQVVDRRPVQLGAPRDAMIPCCSQASPQSKLWRPTASLLSLVVEDQAHCAFPNLGEIPFRCAHDSILSKYQSLRILGAVQSPDDNTF